VAVGVLPADVDVIDGEKLLAMVVEEDDRCGQGWTESSLSWLGGSVQKCSD
jgi:hypothetical protein